MCSAPKPPALLGLFSSSSFASPPSSSGSKNQSGCDIVRKVRSVRKLGRSPEHFDVVFHFILPLLLRTDCSFFFRKIVMQRCLFRSIYAQS